jgi:hypothetical protein
VLFATGHLYSGSIDAGSRHVGSFSHHTDLQMDSCSKASSSPAPSLNATAVAPDWGIQTYEVRRKSLALYLVIGFSYIVLNPSHSSYHNRLHHVPYLNRLHLPFHPQLLDLIGLCSHKAISLLC